ncbi:MAG: hypothetical protein ACRENG_17125 [bacterium]
MFIGIIKKSKNIFKERYGGEFYVLLWGLDGPSHEEIMAKLRTNKISFIRIEDILPDYNSAKANYFISHDTHPNKSAHAAIAEYLVNFCQHISRGTD